MSIENIDNYNKKLIEFANTMSIMLNSASKDSVESMKNVVEEVENLLNTLENIDLDTAKELLPTLTLDQLAALAAGEEKIKKMRDEVEKLREAAEKSESGFERIKNGLEKVLDSGKNIKEIKNGLDHISSGFSDVEKAAKLFSGALQSIDKISGISIFGELTDGLRIMTNTVNSTLDGAKIGAAFGPIGAGVGAAVGFVSSALKLVAENKQHLDMLEKQVAQNEEKAYLANFDVNRLHRERYEWAQKTGETNLEYIARQGQALKEMREANKSEQDELMAEMWKMKYKDSESVEGGALYLSKGRVEEKWESLAGKSFEEIERFANTGKLSEQGVKYYEALKKAREEGDKLADRQEQYVDEAAKKLTGTTHDELLNGIVTAFKEGKRSIQDFADTFNDIMRVALMQTFSKDMEEPIRKWYEDFQTAMKKGLTPEKKNELHESFNDTIVKPGEQYIVSLEKVLGKSFSSKKQSSGPNPSDEFNKFNDYIISATFNLQKEQLSLMQDGYKERLELSRLEFEEKKRIQEKEYHEKEKHIEKLAVKEQEAARKRLDNLRDEQVKANEIAKQTRDAKIREESIREIQEYEKQFTAFMFSEEQKRQQNVRSKYEKVQGDLQEKYFNLEDPRTYNKLSKDAGTAEQAELVQPLLDKFQTTEESREKLIRYYNQMIALLQEMNTKEGGFYEGKLDDVIKNAQEDKVREVGNFDSSASGKDIYSILFKDGSDKTLKEMRTIIEEVEIFLDLIKKGNLEGAQLKFPDLSIEQITNFSKDGEGLNKAKKQLEGMSDAANNMEVGFHKMSAGLKNIFSSNPKEFQKSLSLISGGFQDVSAMGGLFADSISNIGELTGSKEMGAIGDGIGTAMNLAGSALQGAQAGAAFGPAGMIVGAGISLVSSTAKIFSENKKHREMLKKQLADNEEKTYFAELDINRLYRQRYEWAKKIGEAALTNLARQGKELKDQTAANTKEQDELWNKLMGTDYKSKEYFKKTGLFGWGKGKIVTEWTSLSGKSWEEIERLAASGKLSEEGIKYYEALKKAREEGDDLAKRQEQYLEEVRETFTGSSYDSLVDSIVDGFKEGKRSAQDFADTFEQLMRGSVHSALKLFLDDSIREWYDSWAEKTDNGLTEAEIAELQEDYKRRIEEGNQKLEELENITGISFSEKNSQQSTSKGFATMSQDTGDELNGRFTALQMSGVRLEQYAVIGNEKLSNIELATAGINTNVGLISMSVDEIRDINRQSMNHLYKIEKNTALLINTNELLTRVVSNTANL